MLVTVTILGLLLVAVLPSIGNTLRNIEIRNAAEAIQNGLSKARSEAVKRNEIITFSLLSHNVQGQLVSSCALSPSTASWVVSRDDPSGNCDVQESETLPPYIVAKRSQGDGSPNVTVSVHQPVGTDPCGGTDTATSVAFNGYGRVATTPTWATGPLQCVQVQNLTATGTRRLQIVIGAGGTVRMCDPAVTDANDPRRC